MRERLLSLLLLSTPPPLALGLVFAASLIVVETLLVSLLKQIAPENAQGIVYLLGIIVISIDIRITCVGVGVGPGRRLMIWAAPVPTNGVLRGGAGGFAGAVLGRLTRILRISAGPSTGGKGESSDRWNITP